MVAFSLLFLFLALAHEPPPPKPLGSWNEADYVEAAVSLQAFVGGPHTVDEVKIRKEVKELYNGKNMLRHVIGKPLTLREWEEKTRGLTGALSYWLYKQEK